MANRVAIAIEQKEKFIAAKVKAGELTEERLEELRKGLDMEFLEYCKFQELKTLLVANGTLTTDEGMTIYRYLGSIPDDFNKQSAAVKVILTQIFKEALERRIRGRV